ncbi:MAG: hypothetical protein FJ100_07970 [Deltaproteobacteria bacterium]|nr:hypothetical protein [Deltaproteobacteria bacterium]
MARIAAGAAAICAPWLLLGCAVTAPPSATAQSGPGANFGSPGAAADATGGSDAKSSDGAIADVGADAGGPAADSAVAELQRGADAEVHLGDVPVVDDSDPVDVPASLDATGEVAPQPDVVLADSKPDAKVDATKDAASDGAGTPTFAAVFDGVIKKYACNSPYCHGDQIGATSATAYPKVMAWTAASKGCKGKPAVVAGNAQASLLWTKIAPAVATCDEKMPPGGGAGVSAQDAQLVADWIAAGAKP